jgi:hypothetical protein
MTSLIRYLLESAVCLTFFYLVYRAFLRKETFFGLNRLFLISSLLLSFVIPVLDLPSPFFKSPVIQETSIPNISPAPSGRPWPIAEIFLLVYGLGVLIFMIRFAAHLIGLFRVVKKYGRRTQDGVRVVSIDKDFAPFSFLNIVFINSQSLSEPNLRRIIAHEKIHIRQHHSLDILLVELATILQWFNPFVRPYKKSLQETHEYLADNGVIAQGFNVAKYQLLIFEQHVGVKLFEFANNFKQSQIKRRLTMITKIKSKGAAKLKILLIIPLASFLTLAFAQPRPADTLQATDPAEARMLSNDVSSLPNQTPDQVSSEEKLKQEQMKKQKLAQMKDDLAKLQEKEMTIRKKLESVTDSNERAELESMLKKVTLKSADLKSALEANGNHGGNGELNPTPAEALKRELKMLKEKEAVVREKLAATHSAEEKAKLTQILDEIHHRQQVAETKLGPGGGPLDSMSVEGLSSEYEKLKDMEQKIKTKMESATDAQQKAELKDLLKKVLEKQEMLKQKIEEVKRAK